jgi:hypothetical protein
MTTLQPMSLGGILDRAIQLLRARFALFIGLALFPGLSQLAYQLASVHPKASIGHSGAHLVLVLASYCAQFVFWVMSFAFQVITTAAICFAASRVNFGEEVTIRSAFGAYQSKGGRLVWLGILQGLYTCWPLVIAICISTVFAIFGSGVLVTSHFLIIATLVLGCIPGVALYVRYALAYPACAIENLSAHNAIKRSISLGEGNRWKICWGFLLPVAISTGLNLGFIWLIVLIKKLSPFIADSPVTLAALDGTTTLLVNLVFTPLSAIVLTLLYYDQRIRREGYDVERMMESAGLTASATLPIEGSLITPAAEEEVQA